MAYLLLIPMFAAYAKISYMMYVFYALAWFCLDRVKRIPTDYLLLGVWFVFLFWIRSQESQLFTLVQVFKSYVGFFVFCVFFMRFMPHDFGCLRTVLLWISASILLEALLINTTDVIDVLATYHTESAASPIEPLLLDLYRRPRGFGVTVSNTGSLLMALYAFSEQKHVHLKWPDKALIWFALTALCSGTVYALWGGYMLFKHRTRWKAYAWKPYAWGGVCIYGLGSCLLYMLVPILVLQSTPYWKVSPFYIGYLIQTKLHTLQWYVANTSWEACLWGHVYQPGLPAPISGDFELLHILWNMGLLGTLGILYAIVLGMGAGNYVGLWCLLLCMFHYNPMFTTQGHVVLGFMLASHYHAKQVSVNMGSEWQGLANAPLASV